MNQTNNEEKPIESTNLFVDLVRKHGEQYGGTEDFFVHSSHRIGCRYADCSMWLKRDGWHYAQLPEAYPTPAECYAHSREDLARFYPTNALAQTRRAGD